MSASDCPLGPPERWIERSPIWPQIQASGVLDGLKDFDARVAGSWPIDLALPGADVDVICCTPNLDGFTERCRTLFQQMPGYAAGSPDTTPPSHLCRFNDQGLTFEVFGQNRPVKQQNAYRHMVIETRLLRLGGNCLRRRVMAQKRQGLNSEAAFTTTLGIVGDPFQALLELEGYSDEKLASILNIHSFY